MKKFSIVDWIAFILVIVGGLNWGLVGLLSFDLVQTIFGMGLIADIVYVLVGLGALYMLITMGSMSRKGGGMKVDMGAGM